MEETQIKYEEHPPCPKCKAPMNVLLFLGHVPDGWVCPTCRLWFNEENGKPANTPLATVI